MRTLQAEVHLQTQLVLCRYLFVYLKCEDSAGTFNAFGNVLCAYVCTSVSGDHRVRIGLCKGRHCTTFVYLIL